MAHTPLSLFKIFVEKPNDDDECVIFNGFTFMLNGLIFPHFIKLFAKYECLSYSNSNTSF